MAGKAPEDLPKRIALVHEWFTPRAVGGAEQVVQSIDALLTRLGSQPDLAALVDGESLRPGSWLEGRAIQTSPIQHLPWGSEPCAAIPALHCPLRLSS